MKNQKLNLDKDLLYELYINQKMTSKEVALYLNCSSKTVRNYLTRYNIPIRQNSEAVKLERSKWSKEKEQNRNKKFIKTWNNKSQEERDKIMAKTHKFSNTPEAIEKAKQTKLNNKTFKTSKAEDNFYNQLKLFFDESDIVRGYYDEKRYPYNCDFYIKSRDLFIEYNGHQTHGFEPFDYKNNKHQKYLQDMINNGYDMKTWTERDVNKLNKAISQKIKLIIIYPKNNSYIVENGKIKNIGKFNIISLEKIN